MKDSKSVFKDIRIKRAKVSNNILKLADELYGKDNFPSRASAVILYLNLTEYYLGFFIRQVPLKINEADFIEKPLGTKINKLSRVNFYQKEELLNILNKLNENRIKIVHKIIDSILDRKMSTAIVEIKKQFDEFNKVFLSILKHYGTTK